MPTTPRTVIAATASYVPTRVVPNSDFLERPLLGPDGRPFAKSNREIVAQLEAITGIRERRWVEDDQVTSDIALAAARVALERSGIDPESLDRIIVAHNFGDVAPDNRRSDLVPSLAARVKHGLGIENPWSVAFDVAFGCPGWLQGVLLAHDAIRLGEARRALVVGAETLSRVSDPTDRDGMIYSDGAGATILEARASNGSEPVGILASATRSDARDHARLLWMGESHDRERAGRELFLKMEGRKLYKYACQVVPEVVMRALERAGASLGEVSKILIHQANAKMDEAIVRRVFELAGRDHVPLEEIERLVPMTISWLGNSSVATIPTLLDLLERGEIEGHAIAPGDLLVFASVGAGMNANAMVYRVPPPASPGR
ncbi:MAG: ketoacyl-ACP synthase III [Thermoanaerobaculia bacterium]|nr:MAG: ketoacyl-ACP synthase III [Thermoanaerobaculia bacterium]